MKGLREAVGVAVQAMSLATVEDEERAVDRVGGFGAAQLHVKRSTAEARAIAALLWRAKYGGDERAGRAAALCLGRHLGGRSKASRWRAGPDVLHRMATRLVWEWLHDRCAACGGVGRIAFDEEGKRLRVVPRGTPMRSCQGCRGTGRQRSSDTDRALALGLAVDVYRRRWSERFLELEQEIVAVVGSITRPIGEQLERDQLHVTR